MRVLLALKTRIMEALMNLPSRDLRELKEYQIQIPIVEGLTTGFSTYFIITSFLFLSICICILQFYTVK